MTYDNDYNLIPSVVARSKQDVFSQGRTQGGGKGAIRPPLTDSGRGVAPPWDFEAKNVPNLINRKCFSILSYLIIFYLMEI